MSSWKDKTLDDLLDEALKEKLAARKPRTPLLNKRQLADHLGVTRPQIDKLRKKGLPWIRVGSLVRFELDAVMVWFRARGRV